MKIYACYTIKCKRTLKSKIQWSIKGGGGGKGEGTPPGGQALGAHQHYFCSHLKPRFKQKFRPKHA